MAGVSSCLAAVQVLRGIELTLCGGEMMGIVGTRGAGKSTLLLCLAGLLAPDAGEIAWFDQRERAVPVLRACYYMSRGDLLHSPASTEPRLHLIDVGASLDHHIASWIESRRARGDAFIVAARDLEHYDCFDRRSVLDGGFLRPSVGFSTRVAESSM